MNIINAKIWSAALRSGEYRQVRNNLQIGSGFCCLGVAHECLLLRQAHGDISEITSYEPIRDALGIDEIEKEKFVVMNDAEGKSFLQIADYIDAQIAASQAVA
jgi:hypothetical protein